MTFPDRLYRGPTALFNDRSIVVWCDAEGNFRSFVDECKAPNCGMLFVEMPFLKKRGRADGSIAIAHGLEDLCEVEATESRKKGGRSRRKKGIPEQGEWP